MTQRRGVGVARGPAAIVGGVLLAFGLAALIHHNTFPPVTHQFPKGNPRGTDFLGIRVNGWTCWLCAVAGSVTLFGSSQHLVAKLISMIVGLALAGAALLGLVNHNILGLGASSTTTEIGLGAAAAVLLLNCFTPRLGRRGRGEDRMIVAVPQGEEPTGDYSMLDTREYVTNS